MGKEKRKTTKLTDHIGGFFFIGGVILFFDRAMLAMGNVSTVYALVLRSCSKLSILTPADPLPSRYHTPPRTSQNLSIFRTPTKDTGLTCLPRRTIVDSVPLAAYWFSRRGLRCIHPLRRILQDDRWICLQCACHWPLPSTGIAGRG